MKIREETALCFDDVLLVPQYFEGVSRRNIDISTTLAGIEFKNPFICANMSFCEDLMCDRLGEAGATGIIHRNNTPEEQYEIVKRFQKYQGGWTFGVAVGLTDWKRRLIDIVGKIHNCLVVLDVAHADQKQYWETVDEIVKEYGNDIHLCLGTFCGFPDNPFVRDELWWNKNICWRVSAGGGSACSTRIATGCGVPTLQAVIDFHNGGRLERPPSGGIIADGGIKNSGDCMKSLAAGASACMMGRVFAGCNEAVGAVAKDGRTNKTYKSYVGNASIAGKKKAGANTDYIEGVEAMVETTGPVYDTVRRLEEGVRSGFSYCGALNLQQLWEKAEFIKISNAGMRESMPHVLL